MKVIMTGISREIIPDFWTFLWNITNINPLLEFMDESVEKDDSASDEESSKDGEFSLPSYTR